MKNCGYRFHALVATRDFIDGVLVKVISPKNNPPAIVQDKVLALIQVLAYEFTPGAPVSFHTPKAYKLNRL